MSAKKAQGGGKKKDKKKNKKSSQKGSAENRAEAGHPDFIIPMVLTSATQELFECRADEDVTAENPYKFLKKEDIIQDMKTRAAVSDFSPAKQAVLDYPEDEMLLVFDRNFTYGNCFYLVITVEAKENILKPPSEVAEVAEEQVEEIEIKTPEPQPWVPLGSESEISAESVADARPKLCYQTSRARRAFGAPLNFSDCSTEELKESSADCTSYQDKSFSITRLELHRGIQAIGKTTNSSSQTIWKYPRNMCTQYEPLELKEEEKENLLRSENLNNYLDSISARFEVAIQQSVITDMFVDEWRALEEESEFDGSTDTHLKEFQTFTDLNFSKDKAISYISWHPTISGVIAVATTEQLSFAARLNSSTKLMLNPTLILFWSFSDPINPQLLLECPDDVFCFEFCPSHPNIIVGGCLNGQVVLWDISAHVEKLQSAAGTKTFTYNKRKAFDDKLERDAPKVRYCAISSIESGHRAPVTELLWLPNSFEVSRLGIPLEKMNPISTQIVTCAPDGYVMFWDLRAPRVVAQSQTDKKSKAEEKVLQNPHGVPNTFKHLNLTWKPLFKVSLPKADETSNHSPVKFSLRDGTCYASTERHDGSDRMELPDYSVLCQPSSKQQHQLENISTKFYVGTEDGDIVYADWRLEKDDESGQLRSLKPELSFRVHDSGVNSVLRSPFYKDIILTVGTWNLAIWKEGVTLGPLLFSACSASRRTLGIWSPTRPGVFFIGNEDGNLEIWDLLEKTHEASQNQNISTAKITCIRAGTFSSKQQQQQLLAISDLQGTLHVLEIPWMLRHPNPNEELNMSRYFEKEVEQLIYVEKNQKSEGGQKVQVEAGQQKTTKEATNATQEDELSDEAEREYQDFRNMEESILKKMGFPNPS